MRPDPILFALLGIAAVLAGGCAGKAEHSNVGYDIHERISRDGRVISDRTTQNTYPFEPNARGVDFASERLTSATQVTATGRSEITVAETVDYQAGGAVHRACETTVALPVDGTPKTVCSDSFGGHETQVVLDAIPYDATPRDAPTSPPIPTAPPGPASPSPSP